MKEIDFSMIQDFTAEAKNRQIKKCEGG